MTRRYLILSKQYEWSHPVEGPAADEALALWLTMDSKNGMPDATLPFRLVKVEATGEIIELMRNPAGRYVASRA